MPEPHKGESLGAFVSKFMGSKDARKKFPKKSERIAQPESERAKLKQ